MFVLVEAVKNLSTVMENSQPESPLVTPAETTKKHEPLLREWILFLRDICIILIVVLTVREYLLAPFRISGESMESSYFDREFILIDKLRFDLFDIQIGEPKRGDVVVIEPHAEIDKKYYIKRIIGMPGESLKIEDGYVYIKKAGATEYVKLNESYLNEENLGKTQPGLSSGKSEFEIPADGYFIMGDNRNHSADARDCYRTCTAKNASHYIKSEDIVGKVWMTLGAFRIMDDFSYGRRNEDGSTQGFSIKFRDDIGFTTPPRFLASPRNWTYPEID